MSKRFNLKLQEVASAIKILEGMTESGKLVEFDEYRKARIRMNIPALEIIFGATIDGSKVKFDHSIPDNKEFFRLFDMINKFYETIEKPIMAQFSAAAEDINSSVVVTTPNEEIPHVDKINVKNVAATITGGNGKVALPIISMMFKPSQIIEMSAIAMELRRVIMRNRALMIGGVALGATAATVAGICVYNHNKNKNKNDDVDQDNIEDDTSLVDMDDTSLVDMDI